MGVTPRADHGCTSFVASNEDQALLVAGGYNNGYLSSTEIFFPLNGSWVTTTNLPRALQGLRAALLNQQVIVIGGWDGSNNRDEVFQYVNGMWSQMDQKLGRGRSYHAIAEVNLRAVCFGIGPQQ